MAGRFVLLLLLGLSGYEAGIQQWRTERETKLRAKDGWLSLAGLFWLEEGQNLIGSASGARVGLPQGFPPNAGTLVRTGGRVKLHAREEVGLRVNGTAVTDTDLRTDKGGKPDLIQIGRLTLHVIERGSKLGVRLKDPQSDARVHFRGLSWFPVNTTWKIRARFIPQPRQMVFDA